MQTLLYCTRQYCTVHISTVLYTSVLYCTCQYCTEHISTVLYTSVLYCTHQYCTVHVSTVLYTSVLYMSVLYCTHQYCTVHISTVLYTSVLYCIYHCQVLPVLAVSSHGHVMPSDTVARHDKYSQYLAPMTSDTATVII